MDNKIKTRIQLKRDTTSNWNNATGFIPLQGEVILYTDHEIKTTDIGIYNLDDVVIEQGAIPSSSGDNTNSSTRIRTNGYILVEPDTEYTFDSNMSRIYIFAYSSNDISGYLGVNKASNWQTMPYTYTTPSNCRYIRAVFELGTGVEVTPESITRLRISKKEITYVPGVKIGDGRAYVQDLPFLHEIPQEIWDHIYNTDIHVTPRDKAFWGDKINIIDSHDDYSEDTEIIDETIEFSREFFNGSV